MGQRERLYGSSGSRAGPLRGAGRFVHSLPLLFLAVGALFGLLTPANVSAAPFFTAAPLVGVGIYTVRATVLVGASGLLLLLGVKIAKGGPDEFADQMDLLTVGSVAVLALLINLLVRRGVTALASVRDVAGAAQRALLPVPPERVDGLRVAARYEAARADAQIGGDFYAVQQTPYGVRLVLGDVRGKGLGAVETVVVVLGAFREAAEYEPELETVAARLDAALRRAGAVRGGEDRSEGFATALLAEIPPGPPGDLRLLNRGHPPPFLLSADGTVRSVYPDSPALPLGMSGLTGWPDRVETVPFPGGTTLLMYTDGVTEARDENGVFYDPEARLPGLRGHNPAVLLDMLVRDVARHTGGRTADDMALLAASRESTPAGPSPGESHPE
ncbi:PP2C family protein-serine/threonine phosphatase [Streptomyces lycii]|nr:PP2C family protein-serine/threonine phosphatase [Streptomyces lycii]